MLKVLPEGEQMLKRSQSKRVWGLVHRNHTPYAAYYAQWPLKGSDTFEISIHLVLGKWGEGCSASDRFVISVAHRDVPKPGFMVTDASCASDYEALAHRLVTRQEVLATPELRDEVFELLDEIWKQDRRVDWRRAS